MTNSSLRIVAAGIALIFAVLTGLFTGMVGGQVCTESSQPTQQAPGSEEGTNPPGRRGGGVPKEPDSSANPGQDEQPGQDETGQPGPGGGIPGERGSGNEDEIQPNGAHQQPLALAAQTSCSYSFSAPAAVVGFLGALIAGSAVTALLFLRRREDGSAPAAAAPTGGDQAGAQRAEQLEAERSTLVQTCIYVRDRATSKALADRLGWALQEVGVATVTPNGVRFDPAHHEAGGSAVTRDPAQVGAIAAVEVPGYVDRGVVLRAPVVTVYREEAK